MKKIHELVEILEDVNAKDIKVFDYENKSPFFDYVIIATTNERQSNAAVNHFKQNNLAELKNVEGEPRGGWVLVDNGDIIIHLFSSEQREFYNFDQRLLGLKRIV